MESLATTCIHPCEQKYPETCNALKTELDKIYQLFLRKMSDYGPHNITHGFDPSTTIAKNIAETGIILRVDEKIKRMVNLKFTEDSTSPPQNESWEESWQDLSLLPTILLVVRQNKWGK